MKLAGQLHLVPCWIFPAAALAFGCVGQVQDVPSTTPGGSGGMNGGGGGPGSGGPNPPAGGTGAGSGAGSASGAASGGANGGPTIPGAGGSGATTPHTPPGSGGTGPAAVRDPGRVTMRLLNRVEYNNTVRDLLGTTLQPALSFLSDAPEFGYDNNADMLSVSPVHADMYLKAAEALAADALSPARRASLVTCDLAAGDTCLRTIVTNFGKRAFRRPLAAGEITGLLGAATKARAAGATPEEALRTILEAMLFSADFLYRMEFDPEPTSPVAHPVAPYEMASRLSYLVYRSMPDQPLFDAAAAGKLATPAELQGQLTRMLADPRGQTFARDFSTQWLGARTLENAKFDPALFPTFTPALAGSMKMELTSFFETFIRENLPASQLLTANFSYLDDTLAKHYGLPAVGAAGGVTPLKRTTLTSPQRGGLLTMAATLTVTSYPTRTSLVKRGAWVLGHLLCSEPPPPPPDVEGFPDGVAMGNQRQILEMHRANPACGACHVVMDNIGIALENYDAVGAWRTTDKSGAAIDAKGVLPGGATFEGGRQLATVIAADPRLNSCVARNMLTYALGRSLSQLDEPYVAEIAAVVQGSNAAPGLREMLTRVAVSDTFRMRHGEPSAPGGTGP